MRNESRLLNTTGHNQHSKYSRNIKLYEPFIKECEKAKELAWFYEGKCRKICDQLEEDICRVEYGVGGEEFYRGYYNCGRIQDIIVYGCIRGKIYNELPEDTEPAYVFKFDTDDKLRIVIRNQVGREITLNIDDKDLGIAFSEENYIYAITKCKYTGRNIDTYEFFMYDSNKKVITEYLKEKYSYFRDGTIEVEGHSFLNSESLPILQHKIYRFYCDDEGYVIGFRIGEYDDDNKNPIWKEEIFKIGIKHKIRLDTL